MNPPYNNVFRKTEAAFATYLSQSLSAVQLDRAMIQLGISNDTKAVSFVYCYCPSGEEDEVGTGNYHVEAEVGVVVNASDETTTQNAERYGAIQDAILTSDLKDSLMDAQAGLTVFGVKQINTESGIEGNQWIARIRVGMMVCGSDLRSEPASEELFSPNWLGGFYLGQPAL